MIFTHPFGVPSLFAKITVLVYLCMSVSREVRPQLNLPAIDAKIRLGVNGNATIFDPFRKRYVRLTPEEWVRQHFLNYLNREMGYPVTLLVVEASLVYNGMKKRFDILAYSSRGLPVLIVECKAPTVSISQKVFDQVAMYNMSLLVPYLAVTNGLNHYACYIDRQAGQYRFLDKIPEFHAVNQ